MKKLLLSLAGVLIALFAYNQRYSFLNFSNNQGLPQSQIQCITQDNDGFLWVGTLGGLAKFNGKSFTTFSIDQGLFNNRISFVQFLQESIWVGHEGGVTEIHQNKAKSYPFGEKDINATVTDIVDYKGTVVISTEGSGIYYVDHGKLHKVLLKNEDASTCRDLQIINGVLYIGTRDGLYSTNDLLNFRKITSFKSSSISGIAVLNQEVYVSTFYKGLFKSNPSLNKFDSIPLNNPDLYIGSIRFDRKNQLWALSSNGILCLKKGKISFVLNEANGLPSDAINCIYQDNDGSMWFGSEGKGLIRFANQDIVNYSTATGMPSELILSGKKIAPNRYYLGSYDKGAFEIDLKGNSKMLPIPASTIWDIEQFDGKTWFATDLGLFSLSADNKVEQFNFKEFPTAIRVLKPFQNKLLVAGEEMVGYIENNKLIKSEKIRFNINSDGNIRDIATYGNAFLIATSKALYEVDFDLSKAKKIRSFKVGLASVEVDNNNQVWLGTENGLYTYDGIVFKAKPISNRSGGRFINFLQSYQDLIFVGTNDGLYILRTSQEEATIVKHYGAYNGLINLETNINSSFMDKNYFWFGTIDGLARLTFNFQNYYFPIQKPKLSIQSVLVNFVEQNDFNRRNGLKLNYTKNNLIINLEGIALDDPESVLYQYWLEGESDKWSPPSPNSTVILNNLSDGSYTLHVRAISGTKDFSDEITFPIEIQPPFWRTWWFYLLVFVSIGLSIRYYFRMQIKRERDKNYKINLENKSRLLALEQQSLNASMNRHFIFNSLNSIQYFINTQDRLSANRYLTNFAKLIRKNLDSAAEGDNMVTLQQELERLELYLSLESMRFKDRFEYVIDADDVDTEQVTVPAMLLQPFVENSIIHGILPDETKKGKIEVLVRVIGEQLEIIIDDNGIGIDFSMKKKADFRGDHKSQGMEITSKRIDLIREMWNKDYELIGPFQMENSDRSIKGTRVLIKIPYENLEK